MFLTLDPYYGKLGGTLGNVSISLMGSIEVPIQKIFQGPKTTPQQLKVLPIGAPSRSSRDYLTGF